MESMEKKLSQKETIPYAKFLNYLINLKIISHSFKRIGEYFEDSDGEYTDQTIYYIKTNRCVIQLIQETFHNGYYSHHHNLYIKDKNGNIIYKNLDGYD
jgi:hypothetical protein